MLLVFERLLAALSSSFNQGEWDLPYQATDTEYASNNCFLPNRFNLGYEAFDFHFQGREQKKKETNIRRGNG